MELRKEKELAFWQEFLEKKGGQWAEDYAFRIDPMSEFQFGWAILKKTQKK